jgi:hypothetical protein
MKTLKIANIAKAATLAAVASALTLGLAGPADAAAGTITYGDPAAAAQWWRYQSYDDCAIMATADVVGQVTHHEPTEEAIIKVASTTPSKLHPGSIYIKPVDTKHPNSAMGTMSSDIPTLLAAYKIHSVISDKDNAAETGVPAGIEGLKKLLGSGRKVIVSLNGEMIWNEPVTSKDAKGNPRSDHAVVVTGIDPVKGIVHLNDSGTKTGRDEKIPLEVFLKSWDTSNQRVVVTT